MYFRMIPGRLSLIPLTMLVALPVACTDRIADLKEHVPDPARSVGAPPIDGAVMLFDGAHGRAAAAAELLANWQDWPRFTPSDIRFRLVRDPEFPDDTGR